MKKNVIITVIAALGIMTVATGGFVYASKQDEIPPVKGMEERTIQHEVASELSTTKDVTKKSGGEKLLEESMKGLLSDLMEDTSNLSEEYVQDNGTGDATNTKDRITDQVAEEARDNSSTDSSDKAANTSDNATTNTEEYTIILEKGKADDFVITKEQAAKAAVKALEAIVSYDIHPKEVRLSAINASSGKSYSGIMQIDDQRRYEFTVNAMNGAVSDCILYYREDTNSSVWTLASEKSSILERKIDEYNTEKFDHIILDIQNGADCEIVAGDTYSVKAHFTGHNFTLDSKIENNTLYLSSDMGGDNSCKNNTITITVPKDVLLSEIKVELALGNLNISDIWSQAYDLVCYCGNVTIGSIQAKTCKVNTSCGNVDISDWGTGDLWVDSSLGNVSVECSRNEKEYSYEVSCSMGQNVVGKKSNSSTIKSNGKAENKLVIDNACGNNSVIFAD